MKNPFLKCRYARGLGDIIGCILHSKFLSWLPLFLTGQKDQCQACSQRSQALNVIFPIPVWRLFFKDYTELNLSLKKDFEDLGYEVNYDLEKNALSAQLQEEKREENNQYLNHKEVPEEHKKVDFSKTIKNNNGQEYRLVNSNNTEFENYFIKTEIYKLS
jgi:hypothetical protein